MKRTALDDLITVTSAVFLWIFIILGGLGYCDVLSSSP
jgi:hypothetical protein